MSDQTYSLNLPVSVLNSAEKLAAEEGVSLDEWIASAVAQKVGAIEATLAFFRARSRNGRPEDLHAFLALAPDRPPEPGDEL